jgi:biofilm protein TabA
MIFDSTANARACFEAHPLLRECFFWLASANPAALTPGRYEIGASGVYALVSEYLTKTAAAATIECHRRYIDIQCVLAGEERVGIVPLERCTLGPYDNERDFQEAKGPLDFITLRPGLFAVFFPADGHLPGISPGGAAVPVKKLVIKVPAQSQP